MVTNSPSLEDLRRSIDQLDDALQDLLIRRAEVVGAVAKLKQAEATPPLRPGREAQILRRLVARHQGAFPRPILVRLWRELLSGTTAMQADLPIAVFAPANATIGLWDLARDHYGSHTPMTGLRTVGEVIGAVSDGRALLGVLPFPGQGSMPSAAESWWRLLVAGDTAKPRVIARLPFGARGNARTEGGDALVISRIEPEASGADRTLFIIELGEDVSRARVVETLSAAGFAATLLATIGAPGAGAVQLIEVEGWLIAQEAPLNESLAALGNRVLRVTTLGGYAVPLAPAALAGSGGAR